MLADTTQPTFVSFISLIERGLARLENTGDVNIEIRFGYCPAGFEGLFREIGVPVGQPYIQKPIEERRAIAKKYGFVGRPKS